MARQSPLAVTGGPTEYLFAYGSLVGEGSGKVARLPGHRRVLGVAMDNSLDLPGYKYYLSRNGSRPTVFVAFADLVADALAPPVNGISVEVGSAELARLDSRERNYDRVEVTQLIDESPGGRTWAYFGSVQGRARLARGVAAGTAVVARRYLASVEAGFRALGPEEWAAFGRSSALRILPVRDLERVDL